MVALFVVLTIVLVVGIEIVRERYARRREAVAAQPVRPALADRFVVPRGYFLSTAHAWTELLFNGTARVGIDDFLQKLVGRIDAVEAAAPGTLLRKGDPVARIVQGNRTLTIPAPLSGKVIETNAKLASDGSLIHEDPYSRGWLALIEPSNLSGELKRLSIAEEAALWLRKEVGRFRNFIQEQMALVASAGHPIPAGVTLLDGGLPTTGVLEKTDQPIWDAFQREFLAAERD
jgi:glycine cleavage system H protein